MSPSDRSGRPPRPPRPSGSASARVVYSTEPGRVTAGPLCKRCGASPCRCEPPRDLPPEGQSPRVHRESAGRGGKLVTVAGPLVLVRESANALLSGWKKLCGTGGALRLTKTQKGEAAFELEIQGDHADRLVADLQRLGYKAKRSGG